jgi:hypothetical protein
VTSPRPFSVLDGLAVVALLLLVVAWLSADNILQEIEAVVLACFVALAYIAAQLRLRPPR